MGFASRFALAAALTGALAFAHPALAGCKRMGFTVNDYGKEGPTRDAQSLLDKHIATWAAEQGVETLYLLTTTAAQFFARRGYEAVPRSEAPAAIAATAQFSELCPASSTFMRKVLAANNSLQARLP